MNTESKKQQIRDYVVERIVSGIWKPGDRLPTRVEFEQQFSTTAMTVNAALHPLVKEEFLESSRKLGTRVHKMPPPFAHYALLFTETEVHSETELKMRTAIGSAADMLEQEQSITFRRYHAFSMHTDNPAFRQLEEDIRHRRMAGIIFVNWAYGMEQAPLLEKITLPMLAIVSHEVHPKIRTIRYELEQLYDAMFRHLRGNSSRRPAVIAIPGLKQFFQDRQWFPPEFIQYATSKDAWTAGNLIRLLFSLPDGRRPDGLLVADDNLVPSTLEALTELLGRDAAARLPIAVHANFPAPPPPGLPVSRFGFSQTDLLKQALAWINAPKRVLPAPPLWIPPMENGG